MILSARADIHNPEYLPPEKHRLAAACAVTGGNGSADSPYMYEISIRNDGESAWSGIIKLDLPFEAASPRFFLPGFLYGTNRGEAPLLTESKAPRMRKGNPEFPASSWWMTRSDRLSHPAAFAWTGERIVGLCAAPYFLKKEGRIVPWTPGTAGDWLQYAGFGCDMDRGQISYTLGYENAPWFFLDSHHYSPRTPLSDNRFTLDPGESVCFTVAVFSYLVENETGLNAAIRTVYSLYHEPPRQCQSPETAVRTIAEAVGNDAWLPQYRAYAGFVFDKPDSQEVRLIPSISWTNGLAAAVPMLEASLRLQRADLRLQALQCINHIVETSMNPQNGLPFTAEIDGAWCNRGWWYDAQPVPGHAAYLVGQAVYLVLKAYLYEQKLAGESHEEWLEYARKILSVTEQSRNGDGEYPYIFSERTGAGLCYDSLSGAWCLAAAALYCAISGENGWLVNLMRSEQYYYRAFISRMECYGGPLDIDKQTDSEGVLAYIRAVRWLHEITGEPELLEHMRDALEYEFTFKFCYNSPIKVPPLSKVGWSSCGGSITSVCNPHIHPMSSSVIDELMYYEEQTGDEYIRSRLEDTILWSCQVSNTRDGEYDYGKTGWMSERFCHSEGLLKETYPDGSPASTWFALMPWACGCILEGLAGEYWDRGYICKIATPEEMIQKWDYEISLHAENENWITWKDEAIDSARAGKSIPYYGILDGNIICEATANLYPVYTQTDGGKPAEPAVELCAFRTNKEYRGRGYFSRLLDFMQKDLKQKGFRQAVVGVEPEETHNREIYRHWGFTEYIGTTTETYPDGTVIDVMLFGKNCNKA